MYELTGYSGLDAEHSIILLQVFSFVINLSCLGSNEETKNIDYMENYCSCKYFKHSDTFNIAVFMVFIHRSVL
jgi:hypothetical protein